MRRALGVGRSVERDFWHPRATALVRNPASLSDEQRDFHSPSRELCTRCERPRSRAAEQRYERASPHGRPSSGSGPHITTPLRKNAAVHHSKNCALMSQMGLGCAKTPAPAAHVETSRRNCAPWSRIVLRARCSIPCRRIVFSTFRRCMSFHTGWVISAGDRQRESAAYVRFSPKRFGKSA